MRSPTIGVGMRAVLHLDNHGIGVMVHPTRLGIVTDSEAEALSLDDLSDCATREMLASRIERIAGLVPVYDRWGYRVDVPDVLATIRKGSVLS